MSQEKVTLPRVQGMKREGHKIVGVVAWDFQTWRLLHAPPQPNTRERFDDEYNWTVRWNMTVPGATYENTVDNRAWPSS